MLNPIIKRRSPAGGIHFEDTVDVFDDHVMLFGNMCLVPDSRVDRS